MLVRLWYASRAADGLLPAEVDQIAASARRANPGRGLTGVLCHGNGCFVQVLEGGREAVNRLYGALLRDPRHQQVTLLGYEETDERRFGAWTMALVDLAALNPALILRYSEHACFDPLAAGGRATMRLLEELAATAQLQARG